ncbi:MAG: carboxypeptidase-like regulatory domain-containing protein, partial [Pyrinomonadaceae bacterium]
MKLHKYFLLFGLISILSVGSTFAQAVGSIGGQVVDDLGAIIVGATVTVVSPTGAQKQAISNAKGEFVVNGLAPGKYTVKGIATKFDLYENTEVMVTAGEKNELVVILTVGGIEENVDVSDYGQVSTDSDANKDATVIKGADLDALPDDPDELLAALQALAGAAAGPNGGQIYIDGFTGGQLPSKDSIREIRINTNPFSAEFDRIGFGRIEILTRPGSDKYRGSLNSSFNDESLNSRNPFALNRAPTQSRNFGGNFSGPITKGKSSFFIDLNSRQNDNNAIINALVLDPAFNVVS